MSDEQAGEMSKLCGMLPGHRVKVLALVQAARAEAAAAAGSGGRVGGGGGLEEGGGGGPVFGWPNG